MIVTIDGCVRVKGAPKAVREAMQKAHQIKNPDYHRLIQKNKRLKYSPHLSEYVRYFRYDPQDDVLSFGRGSLDRLRDYCRRIGGVHQEVDRRVERSCPMPGRGLLRLRDYQTGVPDEIARHDHGLARLDTGFGKTIVALEIARLKSQRTLILVPKLDLVDQFVADCKAHLGFEPFVIQGDRCETGGAITIATPTSLRNRIVEGKVGRDDFGCVIVDECHQFVPEKRRQLVEYFNAKYRYGMTGTDRRSDGQGGALAFLFGEKVIDREMPRKQPTVNCVDYHGHHFGLEYHEIIDEQVRDDRRNQLVSELVERQVAAGRKTLILTKRVEHYQDLAERLERSGVHGVHALSSSEERAARKSRMANLRSNPDSYQVLLGTFSLLGTGTDIPSLDTLVIAGDLKSDVLTEQSAGRVLRLFEGKPDPRIIDVVDKGNGILRNQARLRRKFYASRGWTIIDQAP